MTESDVDRWRWGPKPNPPAPQQRRALHKRTARVLGAVTIAILVGAGVYVVFVVGFMPPRYDWIANVILGTFFSLVAVVGFVGGLDRDDPKRRGSLIVGLVFQAIAVAMFAGVGHICHGGNDCPAGE